MPVEPTVQPAAIAEDVTCAGCGYNLRGLDATGLCPECALGIGESLEALRRRELRLGSLLSSQSGRWLCLAGVGLIIFLAGAAFEYALLFLHAASRQPTSAHLVEIAASYVVMGLGIWTLSRKSAGELARSRRMRLAMRSMMTLTCALVSVVVIQYILRKREPRSYMTWEDLSIWSCNSLTTIASFAYLSDAALRLGRWYLRAACLLLSLIGVMSLIGIGMAAGYIPSGFMNGLVLPIPDQPLLGPTFSVPQAILRNPFSADFWRRLPSFIWFLTATAVLIWFAIVFLRLASMANSSQKSEANLRS